MRRSGETCTLLSDLRLSGELFLHILPECLFKISGHLTSTLRVSVHGLWPQSATALRRALYRTGDVVLTFNASSRRYRTLRKDSPSDSNRSISSGRSLTDRERIESTQEHCHRCQQVLRSSSAGGSARPSNSENTFTTKGGDSHVCPRT